MRHPQRPAAGHPDEEKVLLLLGGELPAAEARALHTHCERCEQCREKMQEMQAGMSAFEDYRRDAFLPAAGAPPKGWQEFPILLHDIAAKSEYRIKRRLSRRGTRASG